MSQYLLAIPTFFRSQAPTWSKSIADVEDIDAALYRRHIEGDDAAFVELFNRHNHRLYVYSLKLVGDEQAAEDITQELWERVVRLRADSKDLHNPGGFFVRMARNLSLNYLRGNKRTSSLDSMPETSLPIDEMRELSDREELVMMAMEQLPMDYREVLILQHYSGYNLEEIAALLGKSPEAIWKRASRAREKLRVIVMELMERQEKRMNRVLDNTTSRGGDND